MYTLLAVITQWWNRAIAFAATAYHHIGRMGRQLAEDGQTKTDCEDCVSLSGQPWQARFVKLSPKHAEPNMATCQ